MASDVATNDQASLQPGGLAQLFLQADSAIERRRIDNIFKQLDERSLTEEEERIIQQRVELQRKLLQEYEKREQQRKVAELQDLWPELSEAAALRALELCQGKEDDAVLRLTEDAAFRRRIMAEAGLTHTPAAVLPPGKGTAAPRSSSSNSWLRADRHGHSSARVISPSKLDGNVFVGRFRSKLGPYQEQALADAAAARAAGSSTAAAAAAGPGQPQPKRRGRPKKHKEPPLADPAAAAAAAAESGRLGRAATLGAAARAAGAASSASKRRSSPSAAKPPAAAAAAAAPAIAAAAASDTEPSAAAYAASGTSLGPGAGADSTAWQRSSSPSSNEQEAAASEAEADTAEAATAAGGGPADAQATTGVAAAAGPSAEPTPTTTATSTDYGTDTDAPDPSGQQQLQQQQQQNQQQQQQLESVADSSVAAAAERVTSMMARQIARLEPLLAAGRLLDFELRRPGASQAVLGLLAAEYGHQVSVPIATAWEVLLEEQKWQESEERAAYEASAGRGFSAPISSSSSRRALAAAAAAANVARQPAAAAGGMCVAAANLQQEDDHHHQQQCQQVQQYQQVQVQAPMLVEPLQQHPQQQYQQQSEQQPVALDPAAIAAALAAAAALTAEAAAASNTPLAAVIDPAEAAAAPVDLAAPVDAAAVDPAAAAAAPVSPRFLQQYSSRLRQQQELQLQPLAQQQQAPFRIEQQQQQQGQRQQGQGQGQQQELPSAAGDAGFDHKGDASAVAAAAAAAADPTGEASDASTTTEPTGSPAKAPAAAEFEKQQQQPQRRSRRAAVIAAASAAVAGDSGPGRRGSGRTGGLMRGGGGSGSGSGSSSRASRAISETGHTCRGRVRQKSHKTTELVEVGKLVAHPDWYNAGYIFPAGFKSRLLFRSSVDLDALTLHECEIVGEGGQFWPSPTFVVTARDREDEPIVAKSCTGCWSGILKRINAVITKRIAEGEPLPPPPRTAIAGPEYFGLNDAATIAAIEALDPQHLCTTYWFGKQQREAAAAGMPVAVQPLPRANSTSGRAARGGGNGGGGGGRKRGRARADAADADDEGDDALGYKGSHWSSISRRERYIKRCTEAGQEAPVVEEQQLLPGVLDPITLEPVVNPTISPAGHVMGLATWKAVLAESQRCPFTKAPLRPDMLTVLTANNIDKYRGRIVAMT